MKDIIRMVYIDRNVQPIYDELVQLGYTNGEIINHIKSLCRAPFAFDDESWKTPVGDAICRQAGVDQDDNSIGYWFKFIKLCKHLRGSTIYAGVKYIPEYTERVTNIDRPFRPPTPTYQIPTIRRATPIRERLPRVEFDCHVEGDGNECQYRAFTFSETCEELITVDVDNIADVMLDIGNDKVYDAYRDYHDIIDTGDTEYDERNWTFSNVRYFHENGTVYLLDGGDDISEQEVQEHINCINEEPDEYEDWIEQ